MNPITKFNQLLESIEPAKTIDRYEGRMNQALNTFNNGNERFESLEAFDKYFLRFYKHVMAHLLGVNSGFTAEHDGAFTLMYNNFVWRQFPPHGVYTAYHCVKTGEEGGLRGVLVKMAQDLTAETIVKSIEFPVFDFIKSLTVEEQNAFAQEYARRFGHMLPPEWTENRAILLTAFLRQALANHPSLLASLRRIIA